MKKKWSLNALSTELDMDRRSLARKLEDLEAAEVVEMKNRCEKKWFLSDVVEHLNRPVKFEVTTDEELMREFMCHFLGNEVYPKLCSSQKLYEPVVTLLYVEYGLSKDDALEMYKWIGLCIAEAIAESCDNKDMPFLMPDIFETITTLGNEAYIEKYWPQTKKEAHTAPA